MNYFLLHFGVALILVVVALAIGRKGRRSEVAHLLWILVFIKLLVPPFLEVPILAPRPTEPVPAYAPPTTPPVLVAEPLVMDPGILDPIPEPTGPGATTVLLASWIAGSLLLLGLYGLSIARFRRLLMRARPPSSDLAREIHAAAGDLGVAVPPRVRLVEAKVSPALWPSRPATLVLPAGLCARLTREERRHVLLHELAHFKHKDHWVRVLEAAALIVYWWLPPVYWVRQRLRLAEETCCDTRVLRAGGDSATYANALIRTVEFLQGRSTNLPSLATGALSGNALTQRITMIMLARPDRIDRAGWRRLLALSLLALLPLIPTPARATAMPATAPNPTALVPDPGPPRADDEPTVTQGEQNVLNDAQRLASTGEYVRARALLDSARDSKSSALLDLTAGDLALQTGRLDLALHDYQLAVKKHPTFRRAWNKLGSAHDKIGNRGAAADAYRRTIEMGGGSATNYGRLGACLTDMGEFMAAESAYLWAIVLDPETLDWRLGLLRVLLEQGRSADALLLTNQLIVLYPDRKDLQQLRTHAQRALDPGKAKKPPMQPRVAINLLGPAATTEPQDPAGSDQGLLAPSLRASRETPEEASAAPPAVRILLNARGEVFHLGREIGIEGVRPLLERLPDTRNTPVVLEVDPANTYGAVVPVLDEALAAGANNVTFASSPDKTDPATPLELPRGATEPARPSIEELERIVELDPRNGGVLLRLGHSQQPGGDYASALAQYERAAHLEHFEPDARLAIAKTLIEMGCYKEAIQHLRRAQVLRPSEDVAAFTAELERHLTGELAEVPTTPVALDIQPEALLQSAPSLTHQLRAHGPGTITIEFVVDEAGTVTSAKIQESDNAALNQPALEAAQLLRFAPVLRNGTPVPFRTQFTITLPGQEDPRESDSESEGPIDPASEAERHPARSPSR